jgi:hypothetical protein
MAMDSISKGASHTATKLPGVAPAQAHPDNQGKRAHGQPTLPASEQNSVAQEKRPAQTQSELRLERQANIVAHLFGDPEQASKNALRITFQEAIDKLNQLLSDELGSETPAPISDETLKAQGGMDYWSPENTAQRIVEGSTAFIAAYQKNHPELEGEALINSFMELIGNGIAQGFDQAKSILGGMNVLEGEVESTIDRTFDLVQKGLENFKNNFLDTTA